MRLPRLALVRVALLLGCLAVVGLLSAHQHIYSRNWGHTLDVSIYPLNGDGLPATDAYIRSLSRADFAIIDAWGEREAARHDLALATPLRVALGPTVTTLPPAFPENAGAVDVLLWGLAFRWWAWRHTPDAGALTRVRLFVVYHRGENDEPLAHSLGLQKGLLGLVHAYATPEQSAQNNIVIAHELLHTVGAVDKYESRGTPLYPVGYADPSRKPLFPQRSAEIMAGRIPLSPASSYMPESLRSVQVNEWTAAEINWLD